MRYVLAVVLALGMGGCAWLEKQNIDICVDYKGRHVCVGRKDGAWVFSADANLKPEEKDEIIAGLGGN